MNGVTLQAMEELMKKLGKTDVWKSACEKSGLSSPFLMTKDYPDANVMTFLKQLGTQLRMTQAQLFEAFADSG